jgi:hypothetical protein
MMVATEETPPMPMPGCMTTTLQMRHALTIKLKGTTLVYSAPKTLSAEIALMVVDAGFLTHITYIQWTNTEPWILQKRLS